MGKRQDLKQLNFERQLEAYGIRLASLEKMGIKTQCNTSFLGTEFLPALYDLDSQQNTNKYVWEGLPDYLPSWLIENMLYNRASLAGFIKGGILYILPYTQTGGIDIYSIPKKVQPITYNGQVSDSKAKTIFGEPLKTINDGSIENAEAVILYDRIPVFNNNSIPLSRAILNNSIIRYQADLLGRIKNNIQNADKKAVFYVDSETQVNQMTNDLISAYGNDLPFIVLVRRAGEEGASNETLQSDIDVITQSLFEAWQSLNSIRCMISGISNGGAFEKKERKIYGELEGETEQTELVEDAGLRMRQLFLAQMKLIYPQYSEMLGKIRVRLNSSAKEQIEEAKEQVQDEGGKDDGRDNNLL